MSRLRSVLIGAMIAGGTGGCTAVITQASFFPSESLAAPEQLLTAPPGYAATSRLIDLDGIGRVRVVRLDNPGSDAAIIYSAGNGGFVDSDASSRMAASLASVTGADIILYDYPGRGGTTVPATIEAAVAFGPAMVERLRRDGWLGAGPVYAYGLSFGGSMAAAMVRGGGFAGLIIEGSAADYQAIGRDFVPGIAKPFVKVRTDEALRGFDYFGYALAGRAPILLLSGTGDKVIRPRRMREFADQLTARGAQVTLRPVPVGHGGALDSREGRDALAAFMGPRTAGATVTPR